MFSRLSSVTDLAGMINEALPPTAGLVTVTANSIAHVLNSIKGREKLLKFTKYSARLYRECMIDYLKHNHM